MLDFSFKILVYQKQVKDHERKPVDECLEFCLIMSRRDPEAFSSVPRLSRRGRDLFYDLSTGDSCPLRIPPTSRGLRFPPLISHEKGGGLPPDTQKRPQSHASYSSATGVSPWVSTMSFTID